jgi:hypothetical protein
VEERKLVSLAAWGDDLGMMVFFKPTERKFHSKTSKCCKGRNLTQQIIDESTIKVKTGEITTYSFWGLISYELLTWLKENVVTKEWSEPTKP